MTKINPRNVLVFGALGIVVAVAFTVHVLQVSGWLFPILVWIGLQG